MARPARPAPATGSSVSGASTSLVLPLTAVGRGDLEMAGGKGANLGELLRAGLPVPPGFVVTTAAYDHFVAHYQLDATIAQALHDQPGNGAAIRAAFETAALPPDLARAIQDAYRRLGEGPVAVRSSATAEDLPGAAFAGQQDTYLNIIGPEALLDAVRRCFASLWTDRAIAYRERQRIDQRSVKLAAVVQRLVPARLAGVMFTANPVTGARDELVIDATPGLGESLVSGQVTPDHLVLRQRRWRGWRVAERGAGRGGVVVRPLAGGGTEEVPLDASDTARPHLTDREARRLARLGAAIQRHFGVPQDIEWAWASGGPAIVQARPMTALPEPVRQASGLARLATSIIGEIFPVRPYPLDATAWDPAVIGEGLGFVQLISGTPVVPFDELFVVDDGIVVRFRGRPPIRPGPRILLAPFRLLAASRRHDPTHWRDDPGLARARAQVGVIEARDLGRASPRELLATAREALALLRPLVAEPRLRYLPRGVLGIARLLALLTLARRRKRLGTLISGVETMTAETNRALEALAARIQADPELTTIFAAHDAADLQSALAERPAGQVWLTELRAFLDRYGHRETTLGLMSLPTWKDDPAAVLGILKGLAAAPPRRGAARPEWEVARDDVLAHSLLRLPPLRSAFRSSLASARLLTQVREDTHFYLTLPMPVLRRAFLEFGRRLVAAGAVDIPDDVFHLTLADLDRAAASWPPPPALAADLRRLVARRQARRAALNATPLIDLRLVKPADGGTGAFLTGTPGSPGVAEGPARIIRDSSEWGRLRPGDVLVAPYTNPSWTPLFQRAIAVVVDTGAAGSHAAIVAREYGLPAVMGTVDGTRRLVDGERIRVDGTRGLVYRLGAPPAVPGRPDVAS